MKKQLSRLITRKGGGNPGGGAQRVSPGVYRQQQAQGAPMPTGGLSRVGPPGQMQPPQNMPTQMPSWLGQAQQPGGMQTKPFQIPPGGFQPMQPGTAVDPGMYGGNQGDGSNNWTTMPPANIQRPQMPQANIQAPRPPWQAGPPNPQIQPPQGQDLSWLKQGG